ncbi:hypothetical protein ACIPVB_08965 [Microbacterium sp. NPDC090007]|uniref:hypothetical protein n=1 Tax=Microbacterium sp. NPDC090007 TaxID=3364204 RepID=UPI0037FA4F14
MAQLTHGTKRRKVNVPDEQVKFYMHHGWVPDVVVASEIPEGTPSVDWTAKELDAYAADRGIDLGGATKKADKVAAIAAATN